MKSFTKAFKLAPATTIIFSMILGGLLTVTATKWIPEYVDHSVKNYYTSKYTCYGKCTPAQEPSLAVKQLINYDQMQVLNAARPLRM